MKSNERLKNNLGIKKIYIYILKGSICCSKTNIGKIDLTNIITIGHEYL